MAPRSWRRGGLAWALLAACGGAPGGNDGAQSGGASGLGGASVPAQTPPAGGGGSAGVPGSGGNASSAGQGAALGTGSGGAGASGGSGAPAAGTGGSDGGGGTGGAGGSLDPVPPLDAGGPDDDRCDVAVLDPAAPPVALAVSGDLGTHDPALIEEDGVFHLVQTGPRLPGKTSSDLTSWSGSPSVFGGSNPGWVAAEVPGASDLWAPDLSRFGGRIHLYYSASTFGSNASCIGHATRASFESGSFTDHGSVICSNDGSDDDWNAIDPNVIVDEAGTPWLSFGSFWSGIKAVRLTDEGARADDEVHALASRGGGAIEAPFIVRRCGFYYLFVSFDRCCNGASSTYNIRVGRSSAVLGPYLDRDGTPMLQGGGTLLVEGEGRWHGPGHNAVLFAGDRAYNVFHAYDAQAAGAPRLRVAELAWDADGWPVSGGP
jgi:arabinan endo-1,5-alpha-L-arabinosidase